MAACRQTVSLWASTPSTAEKMTTAPSSTRSDRSTSAVKSTWPGVSMMLIVIGCPCGVLPAAGDRRRDDRDAPLPLLFQVVGRRVSLVHVPHPVDLTGVVEDAFGGRGLAGVDVGNDADVADLAEVRLVGVAGHVRLFLFPAVPIHPTWSGGGKSSICWVCPSSARPRVSPDRSYSKFTARSPEAARVARARRRPGSSPRQLRSWLASRFPHAARRETLKA